MPRALLKHARGKLPPTVKHRVLIVLSSLCSAKRLVVLCGAKRRLKMKGKRAGFRNQIAEIRNQAESNLFFKLFYLPQRSQSALRK